MYGENLVVYIVTIAIKKNQNKKIEEMEATLGSVSLGPIPNFPSLL